MAQICRHSWRKNSSRSCRKVALLDWGCGSLLYQYGCSLHGSHWTPPLLLQAYHGIIISQQAQHLDAWSEARPVGLRWVAMETIICVLEVGNMLPCCTWANHQQNKTVCVVCFVLFFFYQIHLAYIFVSRSKLCSSRSRLFRRRKRKSGWRRLLLDMSTLVPCCQWALLARSFNDLQVENRPTVFRDEVTRYKAFVVINKLHTGVGDRKWQHQHRQFKEINI